MKLHFIPSLELSQLPQVGFDNGDRAHETTQARAVGAENNGHVTGEIHCANRIRIVMDVRRVQTGFTAVSTDPLRLWPDQAHAGAAGVEMHFPLGREKRLHVALGEILRRAMGAVNHPDLTHIKQVMKLLIGYVHTHAAITQWRNMQHVTRT